MSVEIVSPEKKDRFFDLVQRFLNRTVIIVSLRTFVRRFFYLVCRFELHVPC